jgi:hypothetical protein
MSPTILSGDSIVVGATCAADLKRNDIALFAAGATLYAHRFLGWQRTREGHLALEFCGDANTEPDPLVGADAVIGIVLEKESPTSLGAGRSRARVEKVKDSALASRAARAGYAALSRALTAIARRRRPYPQFGSD